MQKSKQIIIMTFSVLVALYSCLALVTVHTGKSFLLTLTGSNLFGQQLTVRIILTLIFLLRWLKLFIFSYMPGPTVE